MTAAEKNLVEVLGQPKSTATWISGVESFNFYFSKGVDRSNAEKALKKFLMKQNGVETAFSQTDFENGTVPLGENARQIGTSFVPGLSGDVVMIPKPFFMETGKAANHMTGYSYDRSIPLILMGAHVKKGVYPEIVDVRDLAPTLSFLAGVIAPAQSEGHVLKDAIGD